MDRREKKQTVNKDFEQAIIQDIHTGESLLATELIVLDSEIDLLKHRIEVMRNFIKELPQTDPQYGMITLGIDMDQVNLDETEVRKQYILKKLDQIKSS